MCQGQHQTWRSEQSGHRTLIIALGTVTFCSSLHSAPWSRLSPQSTEVRGQLRGRVVLRKLAHGCVRCPGLIHLCTFTQSPQSTSPQTHSKTCLHWGQKLSWHASHCAEKQQWCGSSWEAKARATHAQIAHKRVLSRGFLLNRLCTAVPKKTETGENEREP